MRAIVYKEYGGPEKLESIDVPKPSPGPGQVLIRVVASSVNPVDWKMASGKYRFIMPVKRPAIPGFDVAGEVAEVGPGVSGFAVGDRVHSRINGGTGAASAEYALSGIDSTAKMPDGMDFGDAAGLPLAGMTALQGLRDCAKMPVTGATQRILVIGASGGVGHLAVQIARAAGAHVVGVCSGRNVDLVTKLGAHEVVDYTKPDAYRGHAPFDIVLDCVGGSPSEHLPRVTLNGHYASCLPSPSVFFRAALNVVSGKKVTPVMLKATAEDLAFLDRLHAEGKLRLVVDSRFPLADLRGAWERSIGGRAVGKILVDVA
ncbi:MAG: NAD(P)-dependent alcohol dehydrogenase [Polyangiaceae bacterium]